MNYSKIHYFHNSIFLSLFLQYEHNFRPTILISFNTHWVMKVITRFLFWDKILITMIYLYLEHKTFLKLLIYK